MNPTDFRDVRDQITAAAEVPDLDIVYRMGKRRRSAVRTATALAVVIVLVATALIGVNLLVGRQDRLPLGPRPTLPAPVHGSLRGSVFDLEQPPPLWKVATVNAYQSYALMMNNARQMPVIARTFDAGNSWRAWRLPSVMTEVTAMSPISGQLLYVAARTADNRFAGYLSRDGGESWAPMPAEGSRIAVVPAGWTLIRYGSPTGGVSKDDAYFGIDPTGVRHRLLRQPPQPTKEPGRSTGVVVATDGSWWVHGGCADLTFPAVSRDRGASWHSLRRPVPVPDVYIDMNEQDRASPDANLDVTRTACVDGFDSLDGQTGYATAEVDTRTHETTASRLYVTRDGGKSWTYVAQSHPRLLGPVLVAPDGALFALDRTDSRAQVGSPVGRLVVSRDGGHTFQTVDGIDRARDLRRSPTGQLLVNSIFGDSANAYWPMFSRDGLSWSRAAMPPNARWVQ
ncbi:hypothetical protein [Fodinicola acaciae]|uniref:hypothetical protein n=1 Tax=Fodinicola acaciae TaxID=2681555 RepID=UPI0013D721AB|nr:hypothetical protein [Fodinicola acaciae]